jgi:hypothetical protein
MRVGCWAVPDRQCERSIYSLENRRRDPQIRTKGTILFHTNELKLNTHSDLTETQHSDVLFQTNSGPSSCPEENWETPREETPAF